MPHTYFLVPTAYLLRSCGENSHEQHMNKWVSVAAFQLTWDLNLFFLKTQFLVTGTLPYWPCQRLPPHTLTSSSTVLEFSCTAQFPLTEIQKLTVRFVDTFPDVLFAWCHCAFPPAKKATYFSAPISFMDYHFSVSLISWLLYHPDSSQLSITA